MLIQEIEDMIRKDYQSGMTQTEIGKKYHISQNHIGKLLSGQRRLGQMKLDTFLKMFPNVTISLSGETRVAKPQKEESDDDIKNAILSRYEKLLPSERIGLLSMVDEMVRSKNQPSKSARGMYAS